MVLIQTAKIGAIEPWTFVQTLEPVTTTTYTILHFWPWEVYNFSATTWFYIIIFILQ